MLKAVAIGTVSASISLGFVGNLSLPPFVLALAAALRGAQLGREPQIHPPPPVPREAPEGTRWLREESVGCWGALG